MSKLSDRIRAAQTNERRHVQTPLMALSISSQEVPAAYSSPTAYVYRMEATFGHHSVIAFNEKDADLKLKAVRRQVVEDIFGEFRGDIYAIERALFERDVDTALQAVGTLLQNMYEV